MLGTLVSYCAWMGSLQFFLKHSLGKKIRKENTNLKKSIIMFLSLYIRYCTTCGQQSKEDMKFL